MKLLLAFAFLALPVAAQLQVAVRQPDGDKVLSTSWDAGSAAPGESIEAKFRVTNQSASGVTLTTLGVTGDGFTLFNGPVPPRIIAPGMFVDFSIRFAPAALGAYRGLLTVNTLLLELRGSGNALPILALEENSVWSALSSGSKVDFGQTQLNTNPQRTFRFENHTTTVLSVSPPSLTGSCFRFSMPWGASFALPAGATEPFVVEASATTTGECTGDLLWLDKSFHLRVLVLEPPLPKPLLDFPAAFESGKQVKIGVQFEKPAPRDAGGTLSLAFQPASGLPDEPAIAFVPSLSRSIPFSVKQGASAAEFTSGDAAVLQTGTTAGTLVVTALFGDESAERHAVVSPALPGLDSAVSLLAANMAEVQIRGFDNTRTMSKLGFTFYLKSGAALAQGKIETDATEAFRAFFASNLDAGGAFLVRISFPVSGTASQLDSVAVEITNSLGKIETNRLVF
jgi:hypothetical protein